MANKKDETKLEYLKCFCIRDKNANIYDVPFFCRDELFAKRKFIMMCKDPDKTNILFNFTNEFDLYYLGKFSTFYGEFVNENEIVLEGRNIKNEK